MSRNAPNHSKILLWAKLPVRYCIMATIDHLHEIPQLELLDNRIHLLLWCEVRF